MASVTALRPAAWRADQLDVRSVCAKLGLVSRAHIAAWVVEQERPFKALA